MHAGILLAMAISFFFFPSSIRCADLRQVEEGEESADAILKKLREAERKEDFQMSLDNLFPLTLDEIIETRKKSENIGQAIAPKPAKMRTESRQLNVTPGAAPQVVRLTGGYSSTLVFQDITGAPWPVLSMILGSPSSFSATQPKSERVTINADDKAEQQQSVNISGNIINIVPLSQRASSNLVVNLEDCPYPVIIHLLTESSLKEGLRNTDALVVFQLDKEGPKAIRPTLEPVKAELITPELLGFIHGVPPSTAKLLSVTPAIPGLRVWKDNDRIFLRTNHPLVWPAWQGVAGGEDVKVYILSPTPSAVLSIDGVQQKIIIGG